MVAGHVSEKKGYYYAVISYTDVFGNRKTKWIATGLPVKGNKKRAEEFLQEQRRKFVEDKPSSDDVLFSDFMEQWLTIAKTTVSVATYASYSNSVRNVIAPYFREKGITLKKLTAKDIQDFYLKQLERVSASSVIHYHSNIHKALKYAVKLDLIPGNPADKVERPKKEKFTANFYDADEINQLFEISKGTKLEIPILFGAFYGLRRSEVVGLKWDAIDFEHDTITIKHTVTTVDLDGKHLIVAQDTTKTKSSRRTLPLVPFVKERLLSLQEEQKENRRLCGRCYNRKYEDYICVNEIGDLIKPDYTLSVTTSFLAVYLTFRRNPFYAIAYAANDIALITMWIMASIADPQYISVAVCFAVFLINDIYSFFSWQKMKKRQMESNLTSPPDPSDT